ncbi:hypothetical protein [Hyphomonas sp.]|uniref:hypothetical protein n=1 Tax=Hyphomonas sp. TaxID=87 RepID=UPI001BCC514F|nr:hypothetical protein [Hyphomonas sp.]
MDKVLRGFLTVLDAVGTIAMSIVVLGGALFGACLAWFVLGAMETGPVWRMTGTVGAGLISGFLSWAILNIAAFFNAD